MPARRRITSQTPAEITVENIIIGGADLNFPAVQEAGIVQGNVLEAIIGTSDAGLSTEQGPSTLLTRQLPGCEVVQTSVDLETNQYVETATESAGSDWDNIGNFEDAEDGSHATLTEGIVLTQGTLIGDHPDFLNKTALTITQVELTFYYQVTQFLLAGTTLQLQYRIGALGVPTTLKTITGGIVSPVNENHLSGETFDITADRAWTWTDLDDLQSLLAGTILVDVGLSQVNADACKLTVTANLTEAA